MSAMDPSMEKLLVLQEREQKKMRLEKELAAWPTEMKALETKRAEVRAAAERKKQEAQQTEVEAEVPAGLERYLVPKGCVALDGISLTIGKVEGRRFNVWIIPHTHEVTTLRDRKEGDELNLECDLLAKYVEKMNQESR